MAFAGPAAAQDNPPPEVTYDLYHDVSQPLSQIPEVPGVPGTIRVQPVFPIPRPVVPPYVDTVLQSTLTPALTPYVGTTAGLNFAGVGQGDYGFTDNAAPPDTNGAVGATQYVQWVNSSFAVFNKTTGALVLGPKTGNTLWAGFGGGCETRNDGDPVVAYDKIANRWVLAQFSVGGGAGTFLQCVAVSTTSDATGTWNRYAFSQPNFNDYPKMSVWPDGYYTSFNMFNAAGTAFLGGRGCAFDRAKMLAGQAATQVCFQLSPTFGGLLPSDLDGATLPPAGSPNFFLAMGNDNASMDMWKFHVDFTTPANSTFVQSNFAVAAFTLPCAGTGGTCVPQSGVPQQLDTLGDRLMHRLAYRNFGNHESLVVNHSVTAGSSIGVRWYEIRSPNATPTVFQQGTYAPDATFRWMGSIAMDSVGNIALGYSASSAAIFPAIRYTGRVPGDALGTLQAENSIQVGGGAQSGSNLSRWGDYSSMTIDPTDDCTFFYTTEYLKATGAFNWSTRIASFKFPTCTATVTETVGVVSSLNPAALGAPVTFTATVTGNTPTGTVNFTDNNVTFGGCGAVALTGAGNTKTAQCITSALTLGTHPIVAAYSGDANNVAMSSNPALSQVINSGGPPPATTTLVSALNPSTVGAAVKFTATVVGIAPTGTVNFLDGVTSLAGCNAVVLVGGGGGFGGNPNSKTATCTTSTLVAGTHSMTAAYSGDAANGGSTSTPALSQVVNGSLPATTTALISAPNPSTVGANVKFTATVTGGASPTGAVNFKDGAVSITGCSAIPLAAGQAVCNTTALTVGTHSITAAYGGDANNAGSVSAPPLSQVVNSGGGPVATTTLLGSNPNPVQAGRLVTFTATVSGAGPTGTVNFKDAGVSIAGCSAIALTGGGNNPTAACATGTLKVIGTHNITATYGGDAGNLTSTSAVLQEGVIACQPAHGSPCP